MAMAEFRIIQDKMVVAGVSGPNAELDILHYAIEYRQDGELTIQYKKGNGWRKWAWLSKWPEEQ